MSELIDRQAFIENERKLYCEDCDRRKGTKNGKPNVICYEIGEAENSVERWKDMYLTKHEPKLGEWVRVEDGESYHYECSECGERPLYSRFGDIVLSGVCPMCGADMRKMEVQE